VKTPVAQALSSGGEDYFTRERLDLLRREIERDGIMPDEFLARDPDCPVFGLNLACAHPFPPAPAAAYLALASKLAGLDPAACVYPLEQTHVTIMTFLNFSLYRRPSPEKLAELRSWIGPVIDLARTWFDEAGARCFRLEFQPPALTRKAAILPIINPSGEIARLRRGMGEALRGDKAVCERVRQGGLNVPGIIHSTVMRFREAPANLAGFTAGFDAVAAASVPFSADIREILLTVETRPYMRQGEIVHRFPLAGAQEPLVQ
jgi:hypothetical protein